MWLLLLACADPVPSDTGWRFPEVDDLPEQVDPPDPFVTFFDGQPIESADDWSALRAPELRALFAHYLYGVSPGSPAVSVSVSAEHADVEGGALTELAVDYGGAPTLHLALFLPPGGGPHPVILGLNKCGNDTVSAAPEVRVTESWQEPTCDPERGSRAGYWPISEALARGYAVATFHQSDVDPDDVDDDRSDGVHPHFPLDADPEVAWGTVAAWSWGLSRAVDALEGRPEVGEIMAWGHSRRGKAALWAAACDERIDATWAHQSGTAGAALSRSLEGESIEAITTLFPHWFNGLFPEFADRETRLPFDQHLLLALVAPRPLLVSDGADDWWADPAGAEQAVALSAPVFELLGGPAPVWRVREGEHEVRAEDWAAAMDTWTP
jgi:hypothetical protein